MTEPRGPPRGMQKRGGEAELDQTELRLAKLAKLDRKMAKLERKQASRWLVGKFRDQMCGYEELPNISEPRPR